MLAWSMMYNIACWVCCYYVLFPVRHAELPLSNGFWCAKTAAAPRTTTAVEREEGGPLLDYDCCFSLFDCK